MNEMALFNTNKEQRAFELLFKDKKSVMETAEIMEKENLQMNANQLLDFKRNAFEIMKNNEKQEMLADYLLDSVNRIKIELEELFATTKEIVEQAREQGKDYKALKGLNLQTRQLQLCLTQLNELTNQANQLKAGKTEITTNNILVLMKGVQEDWFENMNAEITDNKLVFNSPKAEIIADYRAWKNKKKINRTEIKKTVNSVKEQGETNA